VVRANYSNPATMKNLTEQDCYAVYREYYQLCRTEGSKHVKIRYVKSRTDREDVFHSEDKVIQFINISLSNAELPIKTSKPLIINLNQVRPSANMLKVRLFITVLKCPITTFMIKDDSESSETFIPIKQDPIFIS